MEVKVYPYNESDYATRFQTIAYFGEVKELNETKKLLFSIYPPNEVVPLSEEELIAAVEDAVNVCSCTTNKITKDGIEVNFTNNGWRPEDKLAYPDGRLPYRTTVTLYFRDGKPLKVFNKSGQLVHNPSKAKAYFTVYGTIIMS